MDVTVRYDSKMLQVSSVLYNMWSTLCPHIEPDLGPGSGLEDGRRVVRVLSPGPRCLLKLW